MPHSELYKRAGHLHHRWDYHTTLKKYLVAHRRAVHIPPGCEVFALRTARSVKILQDVGETAAQFVPAQPARRETLRESPSIVNKEVTHMFRGHSAKR